MRSNPDGTKPRATRFLGFANTCDLSAVLDPTGKDADMTIKIDGVSETKTVAFTATSLEPVTVEDASPPTTAATASAVTVAEAVAALTTAAFTGITWSADTATGRLKGVAATGTYVQVTGALAAALDFGQGITHGGNGLEFVRVFDDRTKSLGLAKNKKDKEDIDTEGSKGTIKRMVIAPKLQGIDISLALIDKDYALLELMQGGTLDSATNTYKPPTSGRQESPIFWGEIFSKTYSEGTKKIDDSRYVEKITINSAIGMESDVPVEAKAWANYGFEINATEYEDDTGVIQQAWDEAVLTKSEYLALDVENV